MIIREWHIIADGSAIDRPGCSIVTSRQFTAFCHIVRKFTRVSSDGRRSDDQKNSSVYQVRVNHPAVVNRLQSSRL